MENVIMTNQTIAQNTVVTQNNNLDALKAKLEAIKAEAAAKVRVAVETAKVEAQINLLGNEKFQQALVTKQLREETTEKLKDLHAICEAIVNDNQVYDAKKRQVREWNPIPFYGFLGQMDLLTSLLTGIRYSVAEHRDLMLAATGLTMDLIEATTNSLGRTPYFNKTYNVLVEGVDTDVEALRMNLSLVEHALGVTVDKTTVTQAHVDTMFAKAQAAAELLKEQTAASINIMDMIVR